jgi:FAD/FMN-containing dehydrogenase
MAAQVQRALSQALPNAVYTPGSDAYAASANSYLSSLAQLQPALIAQPKDVYDVSTIVKTLKPFVDCGDVKVAIKAGGATPMPGAASIDGGVVIDLKHLTGIELSDDKNSVTLGVGEKWGAVYGALESHGVAVAGGRSSRSSVGGQVTNGGIAFYLVRTSIALTSNRGPVLAITSSRVLLRPGNFV